ncbi:MAG: MBL fold metallo-hydrolase [Ignavibacteriae bacterium]|nr:MBL fold metallo-hydrolase [Ignavibacteriota bacterium]
MKPRSAVAAHIVALLSFPVYSFALQTSVVLLGTGTPYPSPNNQGPATAIVVGDRYFLVDAGAGVMRQVNAAKLSLKGPTAAFITHLHSDHTLGYPDLIFTTWIMQRHHPFAVYGPTGLQEMTDHFIAAYEQDIPIRTDGLEQETPEGYVVTVREITPGVIFDSLDVLVTAIPVPHGTWKEAYAYRFDTPDRSVVISGDMRPSEEFVLATQGVDVLVSEVYPEVRLAPEDRPGGEHWPQYMKEFHTSDVELGRMAARIQPKLLILHHIVWMGGTEKELLNGIRKGGFRGKTVIGKDLERY